MGLTATAGGIFVKGINLGGDAVTIEGNRWLSYSAALAGGLNMTGGQTGRTNSVTFSPPADPDTTSMLGTGIWTPAASGSFTLTQSLPNGNYQLYLWEVEDDSDHARSFNVNLQGSTVATGIGDQLLGHWSKYGPYSFTVTGSVLTINVAGSRGDPQLMGLAIFNADASSPPNAPTGLAATAGDAQVALSWNVSSGAASYNVKRSTTSGGPYTTIGSPTTTSYTNTGLTNGTTYYYVVSAVNAGGESANSSQVSATPQNPQAMLVTGKRITLPPLGAQFNVGSFPANMLLSPNGQFAVVGDTGFREKLRALRTSDGAGVAAGLDFSNRSPNPLTYGLYYGLAFGSGGTLYAARGNDQSIAVVNLAADGTLSLTDSIPTRSGDPQQLAPSDFPTGLATDNRGYLYVANNDPGIPTEPGSVAIYNTATKAEVGRYKFSGSFYGTPNAPFALAALASGGKVYVGSQRDSTVYVLNTTDPTAPSLQSSIASGAHPICLLLNGAQTRLFVANAHSDTVSVVDTANDAILSTIPLRPQGTQGLFGATPTGLALSPDENTLYVTLGDMNAVAVVDVARAQVSGYIPVGWYPTAVAVAPDNGRLLVANAKGTTPRYPDPGYDFTGDWLGQPQYILNLIEGSVQTIPLPISSAALADYTNQVIANNRIASIGNPNPLAGISLQAGKIQHVIYIMKENRTYDQVFGDLPQGNGSPALTLFGRDVTPNHHALAERFVLLDNFYCCGEASEDGWDWSTQAHANELIVRNTPYTYSGRSGNGFGYLPGGFPATDLDGNLMSVLYPLGAPPVPDVTEAPGGRLWDRVRGAGLTFRNYGFFYSGGVTLPGIGQVLPDNYPASAGLLPAGRDLAGISDFDYRRFDLGYADSDAPQIWFDQSGDANCLYPTSQYGKYNMPSRFSEWNREFQQMLVNDPTGGSVPNFMMLDLCSDHTVGYSGGSHSPRSMVADNDYAIGQIVDVVSRSPIWSSTAIFILEDDAQTGPDHVDAHRSVCLAISPWIRSGSVDHSFQNTNSVIRTMELLLNLSPMNLYDAVSDPILDWDVSPSNSGPYTAILPSKDLISELNPTLSSLGPGDARRALVSASATLDFSMPDRADPGLLNALIWKSVKGANSKMPDLHDQSLP